MQRIFASHGGAKRPTISITARLNSLVKSAISTIPETAWTPIKYTNAIYDDTTGQWISDAEVAEIPFIAFGSKRVRGCS